ncbi:hypothetical protein ONS95_002082 [Cadophora gregata]|uniref:uncharacterized protein n=1 Tax=Cadophora gregata TaxID=51156 RepID=UPI0026DB2E81|nr:uncharacterized protein ONS95_002082 [Cadophora gregata]KAK0111745.1 hypothetical protein ONS95_002082 [Cadophora gregata]
MNIFSLRHHSTDSPSTRQSLLPLYSQKGNIALNMSHPSVESLSSEIESQPDFRAYKLPTARIDRKRLVQTLERRFGQSGFRVELKLNQYTVFVAEDLTEASFRHVDL